MLPLFCLARIVRRLCHYNAYRRLCQEEFSYFLIFLLFGQKYINITAFRREDTRLTGTAKSPERSRRGFYISMPYRQGAAVKYFKTAYKIIAFTGIQSFPLFRPRKRSYNNHTRPLPPPKAPRMTSKFVRRLIYHIFPIRGLFPRYSYL